MDKYSLGIPSDKIYVSETLHALQARLIDPNIMTYMDEYAILLKFKSDYTRLNKLVHDMLHIDPARPETCVALAAFWERKDERKALTYAEKVIPFYRYGLWKLPFHLMFVTLFYILQSLRVDDRHITGYIMKVIPQSIVHTS
jgi:anaphase-promoting complex subunit 7